MLWLLWVLRCGVCTYGFVADCAECLQVVQRALASSAVHWTDMVDLPEIPFDRSSYHLVQLEAHPECNGEHLSTTATLGCSLILL